MNKKPSILVHCAIWGIIFLSPLSFLNRGGEGFDHLHYLMMCVGPLALMIVFYTNYLWLAPVYFMRHERRIYFLVNIVMVVALGIFVHYWLHHVDMFFSDDDRPRRALPFVQTFLFILRHVFNLCVAAAIATTIQLAMGWRRSEDARLKAEAARTDAELKNLRSQINPHFLLNTLNNIYALTAIDTDRAQQAIQQLSGLMRHVLYDNQQERVSLADEVRFLENYVNLMKIRLPKSVEVTFDIHIHKPNLQVAPLLFISLVENAFKHGVSPTAESFIHILMETSSEAQGDVVRFRIENSNHPKTSQDHSGHGIGLQQVQRRLDLSYPHRYQWTKGPSTDARVYLSEIIIHNS